MVERVGLLLVVARSIPFKLLLTCAAAYVVSTALCAHHCCSHIHCARTVRRVLCGVVERGGGCTRESCCVAVSHMS